MHHLEYFLNPSHATDDPPQISVAAGIIIGLIASLVQSAGLTLQRKSHIDNESFPEEQRKPERRRPLWLFGFAIFITSNILGSVFQIASLPVVILAPLGAVSLLWNALFARIILGDAFSRFMALGTLLIAGGAVLIAIFGIVPEPTHSLEDLLKLFQREAFIIYFSLLGVSLGVVLIITHIVESRLPVEAVYETPLLDPIELPEEGRPNGLAEPSTRPASERTPLLMDNKSTTSLPHPSSTRTSKAVQTTKMWLAISYASASGILSGMCLLFAKSSVELLVLTFTTPNNQFVHWQSWLLVLGLVAFALLQLWYLHKSLILADPTLVCPLAFCFYNLSSILNGLVYYNQFELMSPLKLGMVALGIVILLGGVWAVSVQSGDEDGTRVEVGTWTEGAEVITSEVIGTESAAITGNVGTDAPAVTITGSPDSRRSTRRGTGLLLSTDDLEQNRSHSNIVSSPIGSPPTGGLAAFPSLRSPTGRYNANEQLGHGRDPSSTLRSRRKWTTIFEGQSGTAGVAAGLSIGLGATSPGFALVPRRRVSSSYMSAGGTVASPSTSPTAGVSTLGTTDRARGRRTVSEGDFGRQRADEERPLLGEDAGAGSGARRDAGAEGTRKGPWGWVRNVFKL